MNIVITKGPASDQIAIERADGSGTCFDFPHKGPIPHDAVHYFVEREWPFERAFWGMVAAGDDPADIGEIAKAAGHASAKRAVAPDASVIPLIQAERLVECFEADLWGGGSDEDLIAMGQAGCEASHVPRPPVEAGVVGRIRTRIAEFARTWSEATNGHSVTLAWPQ